MVPIVIELRSAKWPISLQDAVNKITSIYGSNCPDGWVLDLLKRNRAVLLFDGLDEINQMKRLDVYKFVEDIVEQNPRMKIFRFHIPGIKKGSPQRFCMATFVPVFLTIPFSCLNPFTVMHIVLYSP